MNKKDCIDKTGIDYVLKEYEDGTKLMISQLHQEILTIMDEIHRVCKKNHIKYCLIAGSALGICNYKGFIPWDDDMDISIERKDWKRFVKAMQKDLGDDFYFDCYDIDKRYNTISGPTMKVRKKGTYIEEFNFLLKNRCKRGDGVFVDVIIYDNIHENKFIDELCRTVVKINMLFIVLLDNLHINPIPFKSFVYWFSNKYSRMCEDSKLVSQPISVPWEKFLHEPVFLKRDVYPVKLYEFEGRKYYSYNNIEKVLKEWYGPNCLKRLENGVYVETLPIDKRKPKHIRDINLDGEGPRR